jgi:hypothetical protein
MALPKAGRPIIHRLWRSIQYNVSLYHKSAHLTDEARKQALGVFPGDRARLAFAIKGLASGRT